MKRHPAFPGRRLDGAVDSLVRGEPDALPERPSSAARRHLFVVGFG